MGNQNNQENPGRGTHQEDLKKGAVPPKGVPVEDDTYSLDGSDNEEEEYKATDTGEEDDEDEFDVDNDQDFFR